MATSHMIWHSQRCVPSKLKRTDTTYRFLLCVFQIVHPCFGEDSYFDFNIIKGVENHQVADYSRVYHSSCRLSLCHPRSASTASCRGNVSKEHFGFAHLFYETCNAMMCYQTARCCSGAQYWRTANDSGS